MNPSRGGTEKAIEDRQIAIEIAAGDEQPQNRGHLISGSGAMRKLPDHKIEEVLDSVELALARGSFPAVQFYIDDYEEAFLSASSHTSRQRYFSLKLAAEPGLAYEKTNGKYSLIKLDHPVNQLYIEQGVLRIPGSKPGVAAAA